MKKQYSVLFVIFLVAGWFYKSAAQDCTFYFPAKVGTEIEMKHYGKNNKLESTTYQKVMKISSTGKDMSVDVEVRSLDAKGKEDYKKVVPMQCKNGVFVMNMKDFMPDNAKIDGMKGMEMKFSGTDMVIPGNLKVGQNLPDAEMKISMMNNGMNMMNMTTTCTNRKVLSYEKVITPAGTFNCYKISMELNMKTMMTVKMKMIQWLAKDVGIVKMENYDKDDKLQGYSLLTAIKN